ncbi:hypothetical protein LINPERHAP2_LOCUS27632, partial [Linum perenne]
EYPIFDTLVITTAKGPSTETHPALSRASAKSLRGEQESPSRRPCLLSLEPRIAEVIVQLANEWGLNHLEDETDIKAQAMEKISMGTKLMVTVGAFLTQDQSHGTVGRNCTVGQTTIF